MQRAERCPRLVNKVIGLLVCEGFCSRLPASGLVGPLLRRHEICSNVAAEVRTFRSSWRLAARAYLAKLQSTERDLTRANRLEKVHQLQHERTVLESELESDNPTPPPPSTDLAEAFQADSLWTGFMVLANATGSGRNVRNMAMTLRKIRWCLNTVE